MKKLTKTIAVILSLITVFGCFGMSVFATEDSVTVSMVNFNVAGLPNVGSWIGQNDVNVTENQKDVAAYFNANDFDIVAVQEDFSYHSDLVGALEGEYNLKTNHSGSFLGGDGLNVFTRSIPIYNEKRIKWNTLSGVIEGGADELSQKGILYTVLDLGNGIYVDFYDIHADAYGRAEDRDAREDNYDQLSKLIEENYAKNNRPVIVTGDFNEYLHSTDENNSHMRYYFYERCGFKDAWVEVCNGGDYNDFTYWRDKFAANGGEWGNWDSVEKFLYKDGGGITVTPCDFKYTWVTNEDGERVSDHAASECTFTFTKTADFVENTQSLNVAGRTENIRNKELKGFVQILIKLLTNLDEVFALLG